MLLRAVFEIWINIGSLTTQSDYAVLCVNLFIMIPRSQHKELIRDVIKNIDLIFHYSL